MRAEAGETEYAAVSVLDREHDSRPEVAMDAASQDRVGDARGHELVGGVAESTEVVHELLGPIGA